jgi:hypothetical protein
MARGLAVALCSVRAALAVQAVGGDRTDIEVEGVPYVVHVFTNSDELVVSQGGRVDVLLVDGGGGGGRGANGNGGGGGGAGGVQVFTTNVTAATYAIVVGQGGKGSTNIALRGQNGTSSFVFGRQGVGGGGGGSQGHTSLWNGSDGGSGGGATCANGTGYGGAGTPGLGHSGGDATGGGDTPVRTTAGGGGAGEAGESNVLGVRAGDGGDGVFVEGFGRDRYYGGGGGGGVRNGELSPGSGGLGGGGDGAADLASPQNGQANSGGGGGASARADGANGGSGIVIVRYRLPRGTVILVE